MRCTEFRELIPALVDGSLTGDRRRAWALHLNECPECARLVEDERTWVDSVRGLLEHKAPADLRAAILAGGGAAATGRQKTPWGAIARYVWRDLSWRTWAEAVALVAVVMVFATWFGGRDEAPRPFHRPGPVTVIAPPSADLPTADTGSLYLTDRLF